MTPSQILEQTLADAEQAQIDRHAELEDAAVSHDWTTPRSCSCGRCYSAEEWVTLRSCGTHDLGGVLLTYRDCTCGSTMLDVDPRPGARRE